MIVGSTKSFFSQHRTLGLPQRRLCTDIIGLVLPPALEGVCGCPPLERDTSPQDSVRRNPQHYFNLARPPLFPTNTLLFFRVQKCRPIMLRNFVSECKQQKAEVVLIYYRQ